MTIVLPGLDPFDLRVHERGDLYISWSIANLKIWEPLETQLLGILLESATTFVDIGANIGYFTVFGSRCLGAKGRVWAFEPEPRNFALLQQNIDLNALEGVEAEQAAAGEVSGEVLLFRSAYNLGDHRTYASTGVGDPIPVRQLALDEYFRSYDGQLDVVKVDCQGAEVSVLNGFEKRLREDRPALILEFWPFGLVSAGPGVDPLLRLIDSLACDLYVLDDTSQAIVPVTTEMLWQRVQGELHPSSGAHVDVLLFPRERELPRPFAQLLSRDPW